jgi:Tol biopolymer transport system component
MSHAARPRVGRLVVPAVALAAALAAVPGAAWAATARTVRVSVGASGAQGTGASSAAAVSAHGRFVAFASDASDLVAGDTNRTTDVFVRDRRTGTTTRVSVSSAGAQAKGESGSPAISADGRFVTFVSRATNLAAGDRNGGRTDVYVRDRRSGRTVRLSPGASSARVGFDPDISADGRYVAFVSGRAFGGTSVEDTAIVVHDRRTGTARRFASGSAEAPAISGDGRFVAFLTRDRLVARDTNRHRDAYVVQRSTGALARVSVSSSGAQAARGDNFEVDISGDGRFVAFSSSAANLVRGDTNRAGDVYVHDRTTGRTTRVSVTSRGGQLRGWSTAPTISADGRSVAFQLSAGDLIAEGQNPLGRVLARDQLRRSTSVVSEPAAGAAGGAGGGSRSGFPSLAADGRFVAFTSASNLEAGDSNEMADVYLRGPLR